MRIAAWMVVVASSVMGVRANDARACAPAPMPGTYVSVTDEEALVVWDAARRVQHFVRRASFEGSSESFGFLVPTPTQPELAEADDGVFARLWEHTRPRVEHRRRWVPHTCCTLGCGMFLLGRSASEEATAAAPVTVLESTRVAGMDATVLAATDATALAGWLGRHGFERSPALEGWLAGYVRLGWILTAFRYAKSAGSATTASRAVRMSFRTERPFFPYREPETPPRDGATYQPPRVLRVYLVGPTRMDGSVGDAAGPWGAQTEHARPLGAAAASLLRGVVPDGAASPTSWLTRATDLRAVRPTDADLFFAPAADRSEVDPVHYVDDETIVPIPVELLVPAGVVAWLIVRRRRRKRASAAPAR
ncbi:MAG: DUF2330 domain-containing protein [Deltaproteobacteria bacterium]|nr:DUF2330 domain-containing protein [Deltaproteobacteria bacterium]